MLASAVTVAASLASTAGAGSNAVASSQAINCNSKLKIAIVAPFTGGAGFLGNEQLSWAKYAVKTLAPKYGLKITLVTGDTPVEQGAAPAQTLAQKFVADKAVVAVIGPSTSGAVAASSKTYQAAGLAHISESATRTSLTKGANREATPSFFRVVPGDYIQGPTDANFMVKQGCQERRAVRLPGAVLPGPRRRGRARPQGQGRHDLAAVGQQHDDGLLVLRDEGPELDADFVFFPTQKPGDAQNFAQQLLEQGKKAKVFGGDGSNDASQFKVPGSYVSNFAPDISGIAADKAIIAGWKKDNPKSQLGSFGPPTYLATQVAMAAIKKACVAGKGQMKDRRDVVRNVKKVVIPNSILGGTFRFSTKSNDPLNAKFYIFQIQSNGSYKLVG